MKLPEIGLGSGYKPPVPATREMADFAAMYKDAAAKQQYKDRVPVHVERLPGPLPAPQTNETLTINLLLIDEEGMVGKQPYDIGSVYVSVTEPADMAALEDKLAQLAKVIRLEEKLGRSIPVKLDVLTPNGGYLSDDEVHSARTLFDQAMTHLRRSNGDGQYTALIGKYFDPALAPPPRPPLLLAD